MKHIIRTVILVCFFISGLFLFHFLKSEKKVLYPQNFFCDIDTILSEQTKQNIIDFVQKTYNQKEKIEDFIQAIQQKFPVIASAKASLGNAETMNIFILGEKPCIQINTNLIASQSGLLFDRYVFSQESLIDLKQFNYPDVFHLDRLDDQTILFFKKIPDSLFDAYTINWLSHEEIWLHHKEKEHHILVSSAWDMNKEDLVFCDKIHDQSIKKENEADKRRKKSKAKWACDLRFKGQVVAYPIF
jgi:hypothetical protein